MATGGAVIKDIYVMLFDGHKDDSGRFWTVFTVMSAVNGGLFAIVPGGDAPSSIKLLVAVLGIGLCIVWAGMQQRLRRWCDWWDNRLDQFEPFLMEELNLERQEKGLGALPAELHVFRNRRLPQRRWLGISGRWAGVLLPCLFAAAWLFVMSLVLCECYG